VCIEWRLQAGAFPKYGTPVPLMPCGNSPAAGRALKASKFVSYIGGRDTRLDRSQGMLDRRHQQRSALSVMPDSMQRRAMPVSA
jgi:hypothetical protein